MSNQKWQWVPNNTQTSAISTRPPFTRGRRISFINIFLRFSHAQLHVINGSPEYMEHCHVSIPFQEKCRPTITFEYSHRPISDSPKNICKTAEGVLI